MLKLISTVIGHLAVGVSALVDGAASFLYSALTLNYVFIRALCNIFVYSLNSVIQLFTDFLLACHYGILDFASFIYDLIDIYSAIVTTLNAGVIQLWLSVIKFFQTIFGAFHFTWQTFLSSFTLITTFLKVILTKLVECASLIGRSIKFLVFVVPVTFISCFQLLLKLFLLVFDSLVISLVWTCETVILLTKRGLIISTSQSSELYLGVLTAILLYYAFKYRLKLKRHVQRFYPVFNVFCRQIRKITPNFASILSVIPVNRANRPDTSITIVNGDENVVVDGNHDLADEESDEDEHPGTSLPGTPLSRALRNPTPTQSNLLCRRNLRKEETANMIKITEELERLRDSQMCIICQDAIKCIILLPCRHLCLCQTCVRKLLERQVRCPVCRSIVYDSLQVYS